MLVPGMVNCRASRRRSRRRSARRRCTGKGTARVAGQRELREQPAIGQVVVGAMGSPSSLAAQFPATKRAHPDRAHQRGATLSQIWKSEFTVWTYCPTHVAVGVGGNDGKARIDWSLAAAHPRTGHDGGHDVRSPAGLDQGILNPRRGRQGSGHPLHPSPYPATLVNRSRPAQAPDVHPSSADYGRCVPGGWCVLQARRAAARGSGSARAGRCGRAYGI